MRIMLFFCAAAVACAQDRAAVERYVSTHQPQIMAEFIQLLSIPNVGTDRPTSAATPNSSAPCCSATA
jgi:hypothetical protein